MFEFLRAFATRNPRERRSSTPAGRPTIVASRFAVSRAVSRFRCARARAPGIDRSLVNQRWRLCQAENTRTTSAIVRSRFRDAHERRFATIESRAERVVAHLDARVATSRDLHILRMKLCDRPRPWYYIYIRRTLSKPENLFRARRPVLGFDVSLAMEQESTANDRS